MTVRAVRRATRAGELATCLTRFFAFTVPLTVSAQALAQAGGSVSILNDYRFRGFSLSDGRPVGILDLSYDAPNGLYAAASGSLVLARGDGLQPLGMELNAGYAKRLASGLTIDLGATHSAYSEYSSRGSAYSYTEFYAGLGGKLVSARISVSPDYLKHGAWTTYGELNGSAPVASNLRLTGHLGMLVPLGYQTSSTHYRREFDWRIGLQDDLGRLSIHADWAGGRPGDDRYSAARHDRSGLVLGLTYAL